MGMVAHVYYTAAVHVYDGGSDDGYGGFLAHHSRR